MLLGVFEQTCSDSFFYPIQTEVSSRPERSEVEGPAVHHPHKQNLNERAALPFVIPTGA